MPKKPILLGLLFVLPISCISDDNRCGSGYEFVGSVPDGGRAFYCRDLGGGAIIDTDTQVQQDTSLSDGGDLPSGMGEPCRTAEECASYDADFCAGKPGEEGYCAVSNCLTDPDSCPANYTCCNFTMGGIPNFCVTKEDLERLGTQCE